MFDITRIKNNLLKNTTATFTCYKHPQLNLVFYPHQKCASTTYRQLFEKQQWNKIDISEINWAQDQVFAHIMDPLVRHRKGIVEGICKYFKEFKDMFLTPLGAKFLTNITIVESHSYTIEKWLGHEHAVLVNWIPIDSNINHVQETFNFLAMHGAPVTEETQQWFLNLPRGNVSSDEKNKLYNMLMSHETPGEILRYIDFDRCLYAEVLDSYGFEPKNYQARVNELKQLGYSETEAQTQADQEVESGQYLEWTVK